MTDGVLRRSAAGAVCTIVLLSVVNAHFDADRRPSTRFESGQAVQDGNAIAGVLSNQPSVATSRARTQCVVLPGDVTEDVLGPHGDTLLSADCGMTEYKTLDRQWSAARYTWRLEFTAEDRTRGVDARDTAAKEEVVLFEAVTPESVRPVWHVRFDASDFAVYRSIVPEVSRLADGTVLFSMTSCVNGTGGCGQTFLHRHFNGRWAPVSQTWFNELPRGFTGRIRHGVRIELGTLHAEAGFYADDDANCCPSQVLDVDLRLRGDALVLRRPPRLRKAD